MDKQHDIQNTPRSCYQPGKRGEHAEKRGHVAHIERVTHILVRPLLARTLGTGIMRIHCLGFGQLATQCHRCAWSLKADYRQPQLWVEPSRMVMLGKLMQRAAVVDQLAEFCR
jgi:hypothetical protein